MAWRNPGVRTRGYAVAAFVVHAAKDNAAGIKALIIHSCGTVMHVPSGGSDGFIEAEEASFRRWGFSQVSIQHPQVISAWASRRPFDLKILPPIYNGEVAPLLQALRDSLSLPRVDGMTGEVHAPRARPVYGRLIVVSGPGAGEVHPVFEINSIGRSADCDIPLRFATGGKRIATLLFEPETKQCFLLPESAQVLTVINGEVLLSPTAIAADDAITIGDIGVRIEPASIPPLSGTGSAAPGASTE